MRTADGRVLATDAGTPVSSRVAIPAGGGAVALPDGTTAVAEPLESGRGFLLWADASARTAPPTRVRLELLGDAPRVRVGRSAPVALGLRHAEILCLLTLRPEGLGTEALAAGLYGDAGKRVSVQAEVSRRRRLLPGLISAWPYRLDAALSSDLADIEHAIRHDDADALAQFVRRAGARDPRRAVAAGRLRALQGA